MTRVPASGGLPTHAEVLDQLDLAVIATDAAGIVTIWNARAETVYGWTAEEAIGRAVQELTVPADGNDVADQIMASIQQGRPWQGSFRVRRKDGTVFTAFVKDVPVIGEDGALVGIVGVSIEVGDPELANAVRAVASLGRNNHNANNHNGRRSRLLSPREREILGLLARGLTGEQIAERLVLSPETVRTHIRNAREKLGASTRVEAVTMALMAHEIEV